MGATLGIGLDIIYIIGTLYLIKRQFTDEYAKKFHPYLQNKLLIVLFGILASMKFIDIIYTKDALYSALFDLVLIITVVVFFALRRKYNIKFSLTYDENINSFITVPTTHYISIERGISLRGIKNINGITIEKEDAFSAYLENIDFKTWDVLLVLFKENSKFAEHYHSSQERILIVSGTVEVNIEGTETKLNKNQSIIVPKNKKHSFYTITDGMMIKMIKKIPTKFLV